MEEGHGEGKLLTSCSQEIERSNRKGPGTRYVLQKQSPVTRLLQQDSTFHCPPIVYTAFEFISGLIHS
jgi:hypothetical protein